METLFWCLRSLFQQVPGSSCPDPGNRVFDGGSLHMWRDYFGTDAQIFGIDILPECKSLKTMDSTFPLGLRLTGHSCELSWPAPNLSTLFWMTAATLCDSRSPRFRNSINMWSRMACISVRTCTHPIGQNMEEEYDDQEPLWSIVKNGGPAQCMAQWAKQVSCWSNHKNNLFCPLLRLNSGIWKEAYESTGKDGDRWIQYCRLWPDDQ